MHTPSLAGVFNPSEGLAQALDKELEEEMRNVRRGAASHRADDNNILDSIVVRMGWKERVACIVHSLTICLPVCLSVYL